MKRQERRQWRREVEAKFPHHVNLVPPRDGFGDSVDEAIVDFLAPLVGQFEMYGEFENGEAFVRYCFRDAAHAVTFLDKFGNAAEKANCKIAS